MHRCIHSIHTLPYPHVYRSTYVGSRSSQRPSLCLQNPNASELSHESLQVQMMMCHYIHQYYQAELDEREAVEVVGLGCCFLACKVEATTRNGMTLYMYIIMYYIL